MLGGFIIKLFVSLNEKLKKPYIYWSLVLLPMLLKYFCFGFRYFPVVDDNIMYGQYALTSPVKALLEYRNYTARPFAVLLDTFVISRLWGNLAIILALMVLLHFASAYLLYKVSEKYGMQAGIIFILYFVLNPLGTDAAYWIAASSRLVAGLFFAALALYVITLLDGKVQYSRIKAILLMAGYFLSSLLSFGFYEQVTALSVVFSILLIAMSLRKSRRLVMLGITFVNTVLIALYYYHFRNVGTVGDRGQLIKEEVWKHIDYVTDRFTYILYNDFLSMLKNGIINGFYLIVQDNKWLYLLAILLVSAAAAFIYANEAMILNWKQVIKRLLIGLAIPVVSFLPFYVLKYSWISNRNTFIAFIGIGLLLETLVYLAFRWIKGGWVRYVRGLLFGVLIFIFMLTNTAEVYDYKQVSEIDRTIVNNLIEQYKGMDNSSDTIYVFNTKSLYVETTGKHVSNCTGVEWAFSPALYAISRGEFGYKTVMPLKDGVPGELDVGKLGSSPLFGVFEDYRVCRLRLGKGTMNRIGLFDENGELFGDIEFEDNRTAMFTRTYPG